MTAPDAPVDLAARRAAKAAEAAAAADAAHLDALEAIAAAFKADNELRIAHEALVAHTDLTDGPPCPNGCHLRPDLAGFVVKPGCPVHGVIVTAAALAGMTGTEVPGSSS